METTNINEAEATGKPGASFAIPDQLTPQQGLQVLIDSALHCVSKGLFSEDDAKIIELAIDTFKIKGPQPSQ
jgi:hypothetical protein